MNRIFRRAVLAASALMVFGALLLPACAGPTPTLTPPPGPGPQFTAAAETRILPVTPSPQGTSSVQETGAAGGTAVAELTQIASQLSTSPSGSPFPFTPAPTDTPASPGPAPTITPSIPCNLAAVEGDVTVRPGSFFVTGAQFVKTWRVRNVGSCPWTEDYALVFFDGYKMNGPGVEPLKQTEPPGEAIDLSVLLT
ncbi:MAG: NBR1-Ig-like domain-containing protein, partial [Omnitrophica WOR_2 bacterium]